MYFLFCHPRLESASLIICDNISKRKPPLYDLNIADMAKTLFNQSINQSIKIKKTFIFCIRSNKCLVRTVTP